MWDGKNQPSSGTAPDPRADPHARPGAGIVRQVMPKGFRAPLPLLALSLLLVPPFARAQTLLATVPTGSTPVAVAVNAITNRIFAVNQGSNNVTVIDGVSDATTTVAVGVSPAALAVNPVTNRIYVANQGGSAAVTVIDGATYSTASIVTGQITPIAIAVNSVSNRIYVANQNSNTVTVIDGASNAVIATVPVGFHPRSVAVNSITNKIYVANISDATVTVIDGKSNATSSVYVAAADPYALVVNPQTNRIYVADLGDVVSVIDGASNALIASVPVGIYPCAIAVNPVTDKVYVSNFGDGTVTVIDGASNAATQVAVGVAPGPIAIASITNKIYVTSFYGSVVMLDGVDDSIAGSINVGHYPDAVAIDAQSNTIYVANQQSYSVSVIAGGASRPLQFVPVTPCRVADTRNPNGPFGGPPISGGATRDFAIPSSACGVPAAAQAYSLNIAVVPSGPLGYLTVWPAGMEQPIVATLNSYDGRVKSNAAIVPAGVGGAISIYATNTTNVVLDINGYFAPASASTLAFYPLTPCRVADTRNPAGDLGGPYLKGLAPGRAFPILEATACAIPSKAQAYSLNFTAVPHGPLGYLTVWPTGRDQPVVATLNAPTGTVTANAAIATAGQGGNISVFATNDTDLVIDINGYFAPLGPGGMALYPVTPCRVLDTRLTGGLFTGQLNPPVNVVGAPCGVSSAARAFVLNAVVVPKGFFGYLTLWPDGASQPVVATLNAYDGAVTSNMAIVPTTNGRIDAFATHPTQLILDSFSYFGP